MVSESDFSGEVHRALAGRLTRGERVDAYLEELPDEASRTLAVQALNVENLPEDREEAMRYAEDCIRTIHARREDSRSDRIMQEIGSATPEQRAALYRQIMAMDNETEG